YNYPIGGSSVPSDFGIIPSIRIDGKQAICPATGKISCGLQNNVNQANINLPVNVSQNSTNSTNSTSYISGNIIQQTTLLEKNPHSTIMLNGVFYIGTNGNSI